MRMSIVGLIALGLVAAFSAALLMASMSKPKASAYASNANKEITVYIAARDLPAITLVRADDLIERTIKFSDAPDGVIKDSIQAIGQTLARQVVEGQPFTSDCFAAKNRGMTLVSRLPPGKRAVTVELKLSAGLDGLLYPGSVVDVLAYFTFDRDTEMSGADAVSTTLLQGVKVLAIDDETSVTTNGIKQASSEESESRSKQNSRRVTLLVDSRQAEALQLASVHGRVSLAMRNPLDTTESSSDPTLLSGGQMGSLDKFMSMRGGGSTDAPSPVVIQSPHTGAGEWTVTVMRGVDQVELRSFEQDADGDALAERLQ
jgi:pilus assembly protein CpaB